MSQSADTPDTVIIEKVTKAVAELKSFCTNDKILSTISSAYQKQVLDVISTGESAKAKANASVIIKKIKALRQKYEIGASQLEGIYKKVRELEDAGRDIMAAMDAYLAAEKALKDFDYPVFKTKSEEAQAAIEQLGAAEATPAAAGAEDESIPKYNAFADVQDIRSFVTCKICGETLGERPIFQCPECGKRYHQDCAAGLTKCLVCHHPLEVAPVETAPVFQGITEAPPEAETLGKELELFMVWYDKWAAIVFNP